ncbi:hypothetical protein JL100_020715 [Skermanella mucosa]|uniref:cell division protein FtsL n=1 Tax=Skermanella mucosa TaxID=1789672 RepID=UPI00192CDD87|nr:hypothetical protein [Skermanella mucosa]UEM19495.1 hypothetical protein JL100_020715 [Skermanella mucosa]
MISKSTVIWLGLAGLASGALFHTSYRVQALGEDLAGLNRAIIHEQEAIQILKAEWSYMNDPTRIEEMARRHLVLGPTAAGQVIASVETIPARLHPVDPDAPQGPALVAGTVPMPSRKPGAGSQPASPPAGSVVLATYKVTQ